MSEAIIQTSKLIHADLKNGRSYAYLWLGDDYFADLFNSWDFESREGKYKDLYEFDTTFFITIEKDEIKDIKEQALLINKLLLQLFSSINIQLVDFNIDFGRLTIDKTVILADEISPDSCRLWDKSSSEKLDKDRFRKNLGGLIDAYKEVATRLGIKIQ